MAKQKEKAPSELEYEAFKQTQIDRLAGARLDPTDIAKAIRERRHCLEVVFSKDGRQLKQAGLVALSRAIFLLATRYIDHPEKFEGNPSKLVKDTWEIGWLRDYMQALAEVIPPVQEAIRAGRLTPRGNKTRAPLAVELYDHWLDIEPTAVIGNDILNRAVAGNWPDAEILPNGICVIPDELQAWAESEGIAAPGEVSTLLVGNQRAPASDTLETPKQRRANRLAMYEEEEKYGRGATARLALKLNVNPSNLSKELKTARQERDAEKRGGVAVALDVPTANNTFPQWHVTKAIDGKRQN